MNKEQVVKKIHKLLALASNNPESHEAKLAGEKAAELMAKYQIESIKAEGEDSKVSEVSTSRYKAMNSWEGVFLVKICDIFECRCLISGNSFRIIGMKADADLALWYFVFIRRTIIRQSEVYSKKKKEQDDFCVGMSIRVTERLNEIYKKKEEQQVKEMTKDLVVLKKGEVDNYMKNNYKLKKNHSKRRRTDAKDYYAGYKKGDDISLNKPVEK